MNANVDTDFLTEIADPDDIDLDDLLAISDPDQPLFDTSANPSMFLRELASAIDVLP